MTLEEFFADLSRFRALMGSRSFWSLDEKHHTGALTGLTMGYLHVSASTDADRDRAAVAFDSVVMEYHRRADFRATHPPARTL